MESKYNNKFFSRGFFRSQDGESYTGITLLGSFSKDIPELGFFYVNSGLDFSPYQIFRIGNIKQLLSYINDPKGTFLLDNMTLSITEDQNKILLVNRSNKYEFFLDKEELFLLKTYLVYVINYIENHNIISDIEKEEGKLNAYIKHYLKEQGKTSISEYNKLIFKDNIILDSFGEYKKICIPSIEHEFHGQKNGVKTGYYFKLFPEYINNIRNIDDEKIKYNGEKYPLQLVVQEGGSSVMLTFTELELYKLLSYLHNIKNNKQIDDTDNISVNKEFYIEMTNEYNGNKYVNKDVISEEEYNTLLKLKQENNIEGIKKLLFSQEIKKKLIYNKFINDNTLNTLEIKERIFNNFSLSHGKDGIGDNSWIFQVGSIKGTSEATLNVIKGDLNTSKGKQYLSAKVSTRDILTLIYKIEKFIDLLNNPYFLSLQRLYKNIETVRLLGVKDKTLIDNDLILELVKEQKDSKFLNRTIVEFEKSNIEFNIFKPNISKQLNTSIFTIKSDIEGLSEDRYPINFKITSGDNKIAYFNLGLSNLLYLNHCMNSGKDFILDAKNGVYKRLTIKQKDDKVYFVYQESDNLRGLEKAKVKHWDSINKENFCYKISTMYNLLEESYKQLIIKSILYSVNNIKYEK